MYYELYAHVNVNQGMYRSNTFNLCVLTMLQGLDLGLQSVEALRQVMEIATGLTYNTELGVFANERGRNQQRDMKRSMTDAEKDDAVERTLRVAGGSGMQSARGTRMRLGPGAISRRVTQGQRATFGHRPRPQAYGRKRWMTNTEALVAAEKAALNAVDEVFV